MSLVMDPVGEGEMNGAEAWPRITQKYLRRYPDSKRTKSWAGRMVHIETENGVWRHRGQGYTWAGQPNAGIWVFEDAVKRVSHCGPEKCAAFIAIPAPPSTKEGGEA